MAEITADGFARWIHAHDGTDTCKGQRYLVRHNQLAEQFWQTVWNVEDAFRRKKELDGADPWLLEKIKEIGGYADKGNRGVGTEEFISNMRLTASHAQTIIFVDHAGNEAWLQPDLAEHLAVLFRIFAERNSHLMRLPHEPPQRRGQPAVRGWKHRPPIEKVWQSILRGKNSPCNSFGAAPWSRPSHNARALSLDMMRVLVWDEKSLRSSAARILKRLHCVFDVPLVWVDASAPANKLIDDKLDFHLVWNARTNVPRPNAWEPNPSNTPDSAMYLDGGVRRLADRKIRAELWARLCHLMDLGKAPGSARDERGIED